MSLFRKKPTIHDQRTREQNKLRTQLRRGQRIIDAAFWVTIAFIACFALCVGTFILIGLSKGWFAWLLK